MHSKYFLLILAFQIIWMHIRMHFNFHFPQATRKALVWIGIATILKFCSRDRLSSLVSRLSSLEYLIDFLLHESALSNEMMSSIFIFIWEKLELFMSSCCAQDLKCRRRSIPQGVECAALLCESETELRRVAPTTWRPSLCSLPAALLPSCPSCPSLLLFTSPKFLFHFLVTSLLLTYSLCISPRFSNDDIFS